MKTIKMKYISILILVSVLFWPSVEILGSNDENERPKKGILTGTVIETHEDTPVAYANLALFSAADSSLVSGAITGENGDFEIRDIPFGEYYLAIHFIGYEKKYVDGIALSEENHRMHLGEVGMEITSISLKGAEVIAEKMAIEYKLDRKVVNVSRDLDAPGSSAINVLEKVPSVRVDIDGNVFLRGSSSFAVYIDGKPSVLDGSEALQQIPAGSIENIEIITNPSAKYDPDGTSGIININLKKNRLKGFSGMLNASVGTRDKYASDVFLNYKMSDLSIYAGIDWSDRIYHGKGEEYRETYGTDTTFFKDADIEGAWLRHGLTFKTGLDYQINDNNTLSLGGEYGNTGFGMDRFKEVKDYTDPESGVDYYKDDNIFRWKREFYSLSTSYLTKFDDEGHQLNIFGYYSFRDGSQDQEKRQIDTDAGWNVIDPDPFLLRSSEFGPSNEYRAEADYARPMGENGKIETGYQFRGDYDQEDYFVENFDYDLGTWVKDDKYGKNTSFNRNIHAIYGIYGNKAGQFEYQVGLRGEYTYRDIRVAGEEGSALIDRFDYFPSVHFSHKVKEKNQFQASYSRRIDRPRSWYLEPNETYIDDNTRRIGNPGLLPEYTDSYEVGYLRTLDDGTFSLDGYFRNTNNKITRLQEYDAETDILYHTFENLNKEQSLGVELSLLYDIARWFNLNLSGALYNYRLEDRSEEGVDERSSNNWDARVMNIFKLWPTTRLQLNFLYNSPSVTAQGESEASWYTDVTVRQELFDKKLSATLQVQDLFATRKREYTSRGQSFYIYEYRKRESQIVTLTVSYRINNFREKPEARRDMDMGGGEM